MPKYYYEQIIRKRLAWILMYKQIDNVSKVCLHFGISRKCFYKWLKRYEGSGGDPKSLIDRSRRPKRSPMLTPKHIQTIVVKLRRTTSFGPDRIRLFLLKDHNISLPRATIYAILKRKGLIKKAKKIRRKPKCYQMPYPGYLQVDIKLLGGYRPGRFVQYTAQDDATRIRFIQLYQERSTSNSLDFLNYISGRFPFRIKHIRTDNDSVFTNAYTGEPKTHPLRQPRTHPFSLACQRLGIIHKLNRPSCPEQNGKVERSHRTDGEEFYRLQKIHDFYLIIKERKKYDEFFNNQRPHMGLQGCTPLQKLQSFSQYKSVTYVYS